jgi:hypothetical protein
VGAVVLLARGVGIRVRVVVGEVPAGVGLVVRREVGMVVLCARIDDRDRHPRIAERGVPCPIRFDLLRRVLIAEARITRLVERPVGLVRLGVLDVILPRDRIDEVLLRAIGSLARELHRDVTESVVSVDDRRVGGDGLRDRSFRVGRRRRHPHEDLLGLRAGLATRCRRRDAAQSAEQRPCTDCFQERSSIRSGSLNHDPGL